MKQEFLAKTLPLCVGVFVLSIIISYAVLAWTEPNTTPPGGNIAAPINTGSVTQTKTGGLNIAGNVGIGTTSPSWKLTVAGQGNFSRDNVEECCSNGDFTLSLAENTALTGKQAGIQFHNINQAEGQLRLTVGTNGYELKTYSYQTDMDVHATGMVQGDQGLCIGSQCCKTWAECVAFGGGGGGGDGSEMLPQSACANTLSAGNRRIFVTSQSYQGSSYDTVAKADDICYNAAKNAGMPETEAKRFYALVAVADRNPMNLLTASKYWNGVKIEGTTKCNWNYVGSPSTMFSDSGLSHPINHDQWGNQVGNSATAMTSFKQTGGSIELLNAGNFGSGLCSQGTWTKKGPCGGKNACWFGGCASGACMYCCDTYKHWYGDVNDPKKWAYAGVWGVGTANNCNNVMRALYCVEKY